MGRRIASSIGWGLMIFGIVFQKSPVHPSMGYWMILPAVVVVAMLVVGAFYKDWLPVILSISIPAVEFVLWGIPEVKISKVAIELAALGIFIVFLSLFPWEKLPKN